MKRLVKLFQAGSVALVVASLLLAAQTGSMVGTWKLNVADSKFSSATTPKSATRTVEAQPDGLTVSYEFVEADGSITKYGYTAKFDAKDYPISGSGTNWREDMVGGAESIALRPAGSNVYAGALKKSGNVVMTTKTVLSKDGKVTTITRNGVDAKGQPTKELSIWDKQ